MPRTLLVLAALLAAAPAAWAQNSSLPPHLAAKAGKQEDPPPPHQRPRPEPVQPKQDELEFKFMPERPTLTVSPFLVDPGLLLLEAGLDFLTDDDRNIDTDAFAILARGRYGLASTWELIVDAELIKDVSVDSTGGDEEGFGVGDIRLGAKWSLLKQSGSIPTTAVLAQLKVPTGDDSEALGSGESDLLFLSMYGYAIENVQINVNLGLAFIGNTDSSRVFKLQYVSSVEAQVRFGPLIGLGELSRLTSDGNGESIVSTMLLGAAYFVSPDVRVDAGLRFGLSTDADDVLFTIGVSFVGAKT